MTVYLIGIDGGGTSCRAAVAGANGSILARAQAGPANILSDPDTALDSIASATHAAFYAAGINARSIASARAVLGVAGNNVGEAVHYVKNRLPFAQADIESDGLIALQGALGDKDGAVAILGTGTIYISRHCETVTYVGGWGFTVGDLGSGARIGHALLQETLLAYDGIHDMSAMTASVLAEFKNDPRNIVEFARQAKPGAFGRYAPRVFEHMKQGDAVAARLLQEAAVSVDEALDRLVARGTQKICLLGGLGPLYSSWIAARHQSLLVTPEGDAVSGAVALAVSRFGHLKAIE
ncbi:MULTISPECIES: N-acetylglucosamine kinase [Rhizobium]|uniref:Glucosamine kinase n=1 Tax=Rhizobium fabae TaxID=573179 RepID=A0A7W6FLL4_9HYPH|nr:MULTISPECIES: N-acetylglucosamine kinase [Rhizobium]MBB3918034.1 glucosamine kinase [Rhizobium fabae]MBY5345147.1 N-acetylglucosamine kinase [Rhizobium leguminosarum]MBY5391864.1 N-acetylglucosamine kinase [Rhizobium leguminosarum]MBY5434207.1 N-acetylglucosamine kinase [Rhizobium leguminosarum]NEK38378.1 N-acetylglucosamine kinase [Rhizobium leguminosarum]